MFPLRCYSCCNRTQVVAHHPSTLVRICTWHCVLGDCLPSSSSLPWSSPPASSGAASDASLHLQLPRHHHPRLLFIGSTLVCLCNSCCRFPITNTTTIH